MRVHVLTVLPLAYGHEKIDKFWYSLSRNFVTFIRYFNELQKFSKTLSIFVISTNYNNFRYHYCWSFRLLYPIERGLKSKNFIFRNFLKNDPIRGNFMREIRW